MSALDLQISVSLDGQYRRQIEVKLSGVEIKPYVRQTRRSRFRQDAAGQRVRDYNDWKGQVQDALTAVAAANRVRPLEKVKIGAKGDFWLMRPLMCDCDNLVKAALDCCKDILIPDDRYVFRLGPFEKRKGSVGGLYIAFWEME